MTTLRAQEASTSTSRYTYHVFLSFRGEDTRRTFTDHLCKALEDAGFRTFRDDDEIERGENIKFELQKAIQESRISIVVFSKNYASSSWCLDVLVMILKRKRTSRHEVLPVFYDVDPSQMRKQMGNFLEAFRRHEERFEAEAGERKNEWKGKVEGWRAALRDVADIAGMNLENQADGHESKFIQKIVKVVGDKLNRTVLNVAPYLIGIESRVKNIMSWLQDDSDDVGIAVICGMGGVGKTTIAKFVYNLNFGRFDACSFLANIREMSEQPNGLVRLQRQLLSDTLNRKKEKINSVDEGITKIKDAIGCKRVLVVLDDVDQRDQFDAVIGMRDMFHRGSKIILTTRHEKLLKSNEVSMMHKLETFNDDEAFELFSRHAFGEDHPIEGYIEHSKKVVQHCGGLPLALQVLGSSLSGRSLDIWESALQKLAAIPDSQILKKLKISYDSLQDDHDKNLFLHIACFFIGKGKNFTVSILDECDFYSTVGMQNLINRCLLTINEHNKLMMHQQIRDMGREIVRQESPKDPGKRSRLWQNKDSLDVLREKTGTETIEGIILNLHALNVDMPAKKINIAQHLEDFVDKSTLICDENSMKRHYQGLFSWIPINSALSGSVLETDEADLKTDAFSPMRQLRILHLYNVRLTGCYKEFPKKLRWLCWHGFPLNFIPYDFPLENLVVLDMHYSSLVQLWRGAKMLRLLKVLNLSHSHALANSPDFLQFPNLEKLILKGCINLVELHESIGELGRLVLLNLRGCKNLRKLPREIVQLKSLEELILCDCPGLGQLPPDLGKMESLKMLQEGGISQLSSTTGEIIPWHKLVWSWVSKPRSNPESICFSLTSLPRSLVSLKLAKCNLSSAGIPENIGTLSSLRKLNLRGNPISSLPGSIKGLTRLRKLDLSDCSRLKSLPELPMSLKALLVTGCRSLEVMTNLPNLFQGLNLDKIYCNKIVEVQGLWKLAPVGNIDSEMINNLGLAELDSMKMLQVTLANEIGTVNVKTAPQGLYECGIYSIFLPGSEIPDWFNEKSRRGSSMSFTISSHPNLKSRGSSISFAIPSLPNLKVRGLNVCVVYALASERCLSQYYCDFVITVNNKTRDLKCAYVPIIKGIPVKDQDLIWLSDWKIANLLMEGGDEVNVSVNMDEIYSHSTFFKVKEFGIRILYDDEEDEQGTKINTNHPIFHENAIDLSIYMWSEGEYILCNANSGPGFRQQTLYSSLRSSWGSIVARGDVDQEQGEYDTDTESDSELEYKSDDDRIIFRNRGSRFEHSHFHGCTN